MEIKKRRYMLIDIEWNDSSTHIVVTGTMDEVMDFIEDRVRGFMKERYPKKNSIQINMEVNKVMNKYRDNMNVTSLHTSGSLIPYFEFQNTNIEINDMYMVVELA